MAVWHVDLSREAAAAVSALDSGDRTAVMEAIGRLAQGPNPPGIPQAYRVRQPTEAHVLRAGGSSYRLVYTPEPGDLIVVRDIVSYDTVRKYFSTAAS